MVLVKKKRRALEEQKRAREEAERLEKYERFMAQMVDKLCEETALVLYPWVFKDERGRSRDKMLSPPYTELVQDLFRQCFDVQEEARIQLNEDTIKKMFVESDVDVTKELIAGRASREISLRLELAKVSPTRELFLFRRKKKKRRNKKGT